MHLWTHGELHDEPGGVPQDEGGDEVPVDDVPQTADAPGRPETDWLYWGRGMKLVVQGPRGQVDWTYWDRWTTFG